MDTRNNRIPLTFDIARGLPNVMVDAVQIQQVILNLIRNGIDAMLDSEEIVKGISVSVVMVDDDQIRIAVTDHGSGITEETARMIFQPFFTTKSSGMGLGLAICHSIIAAHGGVLSFTNNPSGGASFHFTLPIISDTET